MKKLKLIPISLLISLQALLSFSIAQADITGTDIKFLSGIYKKTIEQVNLLRDELAEMKSVSDSAMKTRELMGAVQEEYHFVDNFNLDNEVNSIVSDFADLTYIDELSNVKDPEQKYNLIRMEINKRFKESEGGVVNQDPPRTEQDIEALERRLRALEAYEKMRDKYLKEAANSEAETDKDIQQRIASSTSMLAYIELERQIEEKERELMAKEKLLDQMRWDAEFVNYLENQ